MPMLPAPGAGLKIRSQARDALLDVCDLGKCRNRRSHDGIEIRLRPLPIGPQESVHTVGRDGYCFDAQVAEREVQALYGWKDVSVQIDQLRKIVIGQPLLAPPTVVPPVAGESSLWKAPPPPLRDRAVHTTQSRRRCWQRARCCPAHAISAPLFAGRAGVAPCTPGRCGHSGSSCRQAYAAANFP